jgi:hypothetical protein
VGVAGGRAKRRKVAKALAERPQVLTDGRSPAPRAVGDLLIVLAKAGATTISPPVCAGCGKRLRTLQRRGEDWYCGVCGPVRLPCANCGDAGRVHSRDRNGQPRCSRCGPGTGLDSGRDPAGIVIEVVTALDPRPAAGGHHRSGECSSDPVRQTSPARLGGAGPARPAHREGAESPATSVLRLIDRLCDAGATGILRPPCPHCGRVIKLHRPIGGRWLCRTCVARTRAQPCSGCGRVCEAAARDDLGRPVCPNCLVSAPANLEVCVNCGRRRIVNTRSPDGPLCPNCPPLPMAECSICRQHQPCGTSRLTGKPWCPPCQNRLVRCSHCNLVKPVWSGTLDSPPCHGWTVPAFPDCRVCESSPKPVPRLPSGTAVPGAVHRPGRRHNPRPAATEGSAGSHRPARNGAALARQGTRRDGAGRHRGRPPPAHPRRT